MQSMGHREKILAAVLIAVVGGWWGLPILRGAIFGPIDARQATLKNLNLDKKKLEAGELNVAVANRRMADWRSHSLPRDPSEAQRLYQEWLTDVALSAGFNQLRITPELLQTANKAYTSVRVTVKGDATFEQLTTFLHQFLRTDLVQRVNHFKVEAGANPGDPLKVMITAEGLCLPDSEPRKWLLPQTQFAEALNRSDSVAKVTSTDGFPSSGEFAVRAGNELMKVTKVEGKTWTLTRAVDGTTKDRHPADSDVELVALRFDRKNTQLEELKKALASHPFAKPQPPAVAVVDTTASKTKLMGSVAAGDDSIAWLYNTESKSQKKIRKGETITVGDVTGTIVDVSPAFIHIKRGEETYQVDLGKTLASMRRVEANEGDSSSPMEFFEGMEGFGGGGSFGGGGGGRPGGDSRRGSDRSRGTRGGSPGGNPVGGEDGTPRSEPAPRS